MTENVSNSWIKKYQDMCNVYINQNLLLSKERLTLKVEDGGVGFFDLRSFLDTQKLKWYFKALHGPSDLWKLEIRNAYMEGKNCLIDVNSCVLIESKYICNLYNEFLHIFLRNENEILNMRLKSNVIEWERTQGDEGLENGKIRDFLVKKNINNIILSISDINTKFNTTINQQIYTRLVTSIRRVLRLYGDFIDMSKPIDIVDFDRKFCKKSFKGTKNIRKYFENIRSKNNIETKN